MDEIRAGCIVDVEQVRFIGRVASAEGACVGGGSHRGGEVGNKV